MEIPLCGVTMGGRKHRSNPSPANSKRLWPSLFTSVSLFVVRAPKISLSFILIFSNLPIFSAAMSCVSLTMIYWLIRKKKNPKWTASSPGSQIARNKHIFLWLQEFSCRTTRNKALPGSKRNAVLWQGLNWLTKLWRF